MNEKEVAEIRRRIKPEKTNITHVRGCYVNDKKEIVSQFLQPLSMLSQEEGETLLQLLRKTLSGGVGRNLLDMEFSTQQVLQSEEHKLLMALRKSALQEEDAVLAFYQKAIQAIDLQGNYLILLAYDTYDVPFRAKDGQALEDASDEVYTYILCSICPVKLTRPALSFYVSENAFHSLSPDWVVAPPQMGFLFPAFHERAADIYSALYYCKDISQNHSAFTQAVFCQEAPMPAAVQKETFESLLGDTLENDCSFEVVSTVHEELCEKIQQHKESKEEEPLLVNKQEVLHILDACGVKEENQQAFEERFEAAFGQNAAISVQNLVDTKQFSVNTPDVQIRVNPQRSDLVQVRIVDGVKYILIRASDGVEVNGVHIHIE